MERLKTTSPEQEKALEQFTFDVAQSLNSHDAEDVMRVLNGAKEMIQKKLDDKREGILDELRQVESELFYFHNGHYQSEGRADSIENAIESF